ncbi:MAG: SdpI family protein, partial [Candidatus Aenigmarchaeota archaeon]|nr:SdpI family protein [Candidatus Aenigmarchaeota archaeon]
MKTQTIILTILLLSFAIGIYIYPQMPDKMASHWNAQGQVDGYMSKFWGVFLMPTISVGLLLLFLLIPKIDPLKANIEKFRKYYDDFIVMMIAFLFYVYLLTLVWNSGFVFNMTQFLTPASGLMFYYIGILTQNAKRNWFIGIRTPWTLSSENVWNKT